MTRDARDLTERIRNQLTGALHIGDLKTGDRLPSIRQLARALGEDQRRVARAYRALQAEGMVEVRGRSGVYATAQSRLRGGLLEETAEWLAQILLEAWTRRITITRLPDLLRLHAARVPVRCAFVDSCEDAIEAFGHELEHEFGLTVAPVRLDTLPSTARSVERFPAQLRAAELIVTTIFSAAQVRGIAERLDRPMITVQVHPQVVAAVIGKLKRGTLTVVCADPSFGERVRRQYADHARDPDRIRIVLADDAAALAALDRSDPIMLTRAARRRLRETHLKMLIPHSPTLSPDSAREILRFLVRAHAERGEDGHA